MAYFAYCPASGSLHFGPAIPHGYLPVARMPEATDDVAVWRKKIEALCRKGYEPGHYMVPGVPEAQSGPAAGDALLAFVKILVQRGLSTATGRPARTKKGALG